MNLAYAVYAEGERLNYKTDVTDGTCVWAFKNYRTMISSVE